VPRLAPLGRNWVRGAPCVRFRGRTSDCRKPLAVVFTKPNPSRQSSHEIFTLRPEPRQSLCGHNRAAPGALCFERSARLGRPGRIAEHFSTKKQPDRVCPRVENASSYERKPLNEIAFTGGNTNPELFPSSPCQGAVHGPNAGTVQRRPPSAVQCTPESSREEKPVTYPMTQGAPGHFRWAPARQLVLFSFEHHPGFRRDHSL